MKDAAIAKFANRAHSAWAIGFLGCKELNGKSTDANKRVLTIKMTK